MSEPQVLSGQLDRRSHPGSHTLLRGLVVLECVAYESSRTGVSVTEVANAIDLDKSTVSRTLAALRDAGYLRQGANRRYRLTSKLAHLAEGHTGREELRDIARPHLDRLHDLFDEELHLAVPDGGEMVFIDYRSSGQIVRSKLPTTPAPAHLTAVGRAVLAMLSHEERSAVLRDAIRASGTALTADQRDELSDELMVAQRQGWASYDGGDGTTRVAAAIVNNAGQPLGALCLSGPSFRLADRTGELARHVLATVDAVSRAIPN